MNVDHATGEIAGNVVRSLLKVPLSRNFDQVRQPAFFHKSIGELRIHPVESQNHRSLKRRLSICVAPPDKTEQLAERPRHQGIERIEERNKDRPERRQHRKSRARPGVGMSKRRQENESDQQEPCGAGALAREKPALKWSDGRPRPSCSLTADARKRTRASAPHNLFIFESPAVP